MVKTRLQVAANVNYDVFSRYLAWMMAKGLVSLEGNPDARERVVLTARGAEAYRKLVQWVNDVGHGRMPQAWGGLGYAGGAPVCRGGAGGGGGGGGCGPGRVAGRRRVRCRPA